MIHLVYYGYYFSPMYELKSNFTGDSISSCIHSYFQQKYTNTRRLYLCLSPSSPSLTKLTKMSHFCCKQFSPKERPFPGHGEINAHAVGDAVPTESHPSCWQSLAKLPVEMKDGIYLLKGIPGLTHSKFNEQQNNLFLNTIISVNTRTITDTVLNKSKMSFNILMHRKWWSIF